MSSEPVPPLENRDILAETSRVRTAVPVPERELPPGRPRLHNRAESVGSVVGKAVGRVRDLPRRVSEMKERFTVIRGRRGGAAPSAGELKETARQRVYEARSRAEFYAHEYPVQFIAAAGAAAFVLGFIMRVWRSSRRAY
ncbi:MAG TPA: hypothetical protein VD837_08155 [Terriglobales bacterium]|nr:hypothetical protein [Terriglobales bacterium]